MKTRIDAGIFLILLSLSIGFLIGFKTKANLYPQKQESRLNAAVIALPDSVRVLDNLALEIKQRGNTTPEEAVKLARWLRQDTVTDAPVLKYWNLIDSLESENL